MRHFFQTHEMESLLEAITALVRLVSPGKVRVISDTISRTARSKVKLALTSAVGTPAGKGAIERLLNTWRSTSVDSTELASMLLAAAHTVEQISKHQSIELVWTGPTTQYIYARRTDQVLLEVIAAAEKTLFLTSFVLYDVDVVVRALNEAINRGVVVSILLESSKRHGGSVPYDAIGQIQKSVPSACLYAWREKESLHMGGRVHAKVAVADDEICFITSANLTGYAMEKNMEAGVLINGGKTPQLLYEHLHALINTKIIEKV